MKANTSLQLLGISAHVVGASAEHEDLSYIVRLRVFSGKCAHASLAVGPDVDAAEISTVPKIGSIKLT